MLWVFVSDKPEEVEPEPEVIVETVVETVVETQTIVIMVDLTEEVKELYTEEELYWLSRIVSAESKGESEVGQVAVANVVLNRVKSDSFPDSIEEVVFQDGQFDPVRNGSIHDTPTSSAVESATRALEGERIVDEKILFFYNPDATSRGNWIRTRPVSEDIGNHRFAY